MPRVNQAGRLHPVTTAIAGSPNTPPQWGHWYRQIETRVSDPDAMTLLTGVDELPLLTMQRVEEGRVAMLSSDQMWLWQRGHDGGGPVAELLRRLSHWLMKEPALDENTVKTKRSAEGESLMLTWRKIGAPPKSASIINPETGEQINAPFEQLPDQSWQANIPIEARGLIRVQVRDRDDRSQTALHVDRDVLTAETRNTNSSPDILAGLVAENNGYISRIEDGLPDFRHVPDDRMWHGSNWAGFVKTNSFKTVIGGITNLLPIPFVALLIGAICLLGLAGRKQIVTVLVFDGHVPHGIRRRLLYGSCTGRL